MKFNDILYLISSSKQLSSKSIVDIYYSLFKLKKEFLQIILYNYFNLNYVERFLLSIFFSDIIINFSKYKYPDIISS